MKEKFDYSKAVARLEEIALKVEDPDTGIETVDRYIEESNVLIEQCRKYLRTVRDSLDKTD